jgi:hypothetical protein
MEAFFTVERSISNHLVSSALLYLTGKYLHSYIETAGLNARIVHSSDVSPRSGDKAVQRRNIAVIHSDRKAKEFQDAAHDVTSMCNCTVDITVSAAVLP